MKAPVRVSRRAPQQQTKKRVWDYSTFMFKAHKEACAGGMRTSDFFLLRRGGLPRPILLRLVSSEASRLSKSNRLKVVTLQEIHEAVTIIRRRIRGRPAA